MSNRPTFAAAPTPATPNFHDAPALRASSSFEIDDRPLVYMPRSRFEEALSGAREFTMSNAGLLLIISSQLFFAMMNVSVKFLNGLDPPVPPLELIVIRMVCGLSYDGTNIELTILHRQSLTYAASDGCMFRRQSTPLAKTNYEHRKMTKVPEPYLGPRGVRVLLVLRGLFG
jgi:hypothetical protein